MHDPPTPAAPVKGSGAWYLEEQERWHLERRAARQRGEDMARWLAVHPSPAREMSRVLRRIAVATQRNARAMERRLLAKCPTRRTTAMATSPRTARPRGSGRPRVRRTAASSTTSSADPPGESEPAALTLWRHPRWGACTPSLLRVLVREQAAS